MTIRPFHFHTQIKRKYVDGHSTSTRNYYSNCAEKAFCTSKRTTTLSIANKNIPSRERGQLMRSCFRSEQRKSRIPETTDLSNPSSSIVLRPEQNRERSGPDGRAQGSPTRDEQKRGKRNSTSDVSKTVSLNLNNIYKT